MEDAPGVGARVHVPGLGTGIVRERRGARAVVDIKGLPVVIDVERLMHADTLKPRKGARPLQAPVPAAPADRGSGVSRGGTGAPAGPATLDLHGRTVAEALEAVEAFVNEALLEGRESVILVHGRSGGRIRGAVHAFLRRVPTVRAFLIDPANAGQTIVRL
jgi:dsDNA-specific endonuclease/ATPase MutS2